MAGEPPQIEKLGRYELITRLAAGGMAEIFLARERGLAGFERLVVIKRILPHREDDPAFVAMFQREARIVARLNHPNVVHIHDLGEVDGNYFIAMEYIHGCTLREMQVLATRGEVSVPPAVAIAIVAEACRGAHAAHELTDDNGKSIGLVHRDISPHNVMLTPNGHVKLIDFGIAKGAIIEGFETTNGESIRGKYGYMSPEQCHRKELDRRSDVFSLGIILWELVAGRPLFRRDSELEMMKAITESQAPPVQFINPSTPEKLDAIIMRALEKERDARYSSAEEMRQALVETAEELGLTLSTDKIGTFVRRVAGERLAQRDEILEKAKEHSLSKRERRSLVHSTEDTGSHEFSDSAFSIDDPEASDYSGEAEKLESASPMSPPWSVGRTILTLGGIMVLLFAMLAAAFWLYAGDPTDKEDGSHATAGEAATATTGADVVSDRSESTEPIPTVLSGEPLTIGWAPTVDPVVLKGELEPLRLFLQRKTARPITFVWAASYADMAERVLSGEFAFGVFPPLIYVRTSADAQPGELELIVVKEFEGAVQSDGYLLVPHASTVETLADLEGKRFCFTDENSTSGNFLPRAYIRAQGYDPTEFIGEVRWSGDHLQVLKDLIDGKCDAAATYSGSLLTASSLGVPSGKLRVLAVTGHIPQDVLVAGKSAAPEARQELRDALLSFKPATEIAQPFLGSSQRITGFEVPSEDMFSSLRSVVAEEKASH